jgi:1,4-dihydroxy-2-naphthoate octaprenyltransferase
MDRDETPIGGLKNPMQPTKNCFMFRAGCAGVGACSLVYQSPFFNGYIVLHSGFAGVQLPRHPAEAPSGMPVFGVFFFQGALVFFCTYHAAHPQHTLRYRC